MQHIRQRSSLEIGGSTPWDTAMDWPTTPLTSGTQEFVWNIAWGPHFGDTEEFVYYITKLDFVFDPTRPLSWDDFETEPFCLEQYDVSRPNNNPNIVPRVDLVKFYTYCNVPARSGRHVIYGASDPCVGSFYSNTIQANGGGTNGL